jgi:hypothetical protein
MNFDKEGGSVTFNSMREFEDAVMLVLRNRLAVALESKYANTLEVTLLDAKPSDNTFSSSCDLICQDCVSIEV